MTFYALLALFLAVIVGVSLGLLGSGGSIVMLPVLVYVAAVPAPQAVSMSLAIVGGTSLIGAYLHYRQGHFPAKATAIFSLSGAVGAYVSSPLTHLVSQQVVMFLFSGLMLVVGGAMLHGRAESKGKHECHVVRCLLIGCGVGVLTGFLGVGGGFLIVPALVLFAGIETNKAVGVSLAVIAFNSAFGLLGHLREGAIDWQLTGSFLLAAALGMAVGSWFSSKISQQRLKQVFAWVVVVMAVVIAGVNAYGLISQVL